MPLDSIVSAARSRSIPRVQSVALQINSQKYSYPKKESIGSIAQKIVNETSTQKEQTKIIGDTPVTSWQNCQFLKEENGCHFCKKCFSYCAKEKCPSKLRMSITFE
jgi:Pyruvate/2-oxoacid:ferredoxin oxidoreductase delta subunit